MTPTDFIFRQGEDFFRVRRFGSRHWLMKWLPSQTTWHAVIKLRGDELAELMEGSLPPADILAAGLDDGGIPFLFDKSAQPLNLKKPTNQPNQIKLL